MNYNGKQILFIIIPHKKIILVIEMTVISIMTPILRVLLEHGLGNKITITQVTLEIMITHIIGIDKVHMVRILLVIKHKHQPIMQLQQAILFPHLDIRVHQILMIKASATQRTNTIPRHNQMHLLKHLSSIHIMQVTLQAIQTINNPVHKLGIVPQGAHV